MAKKKPGLDYKSLAGKKSWKPLPAVVVMTGPATFLKRLIIERFTREVFGEAEADVRRFEAQKSGSGGPTLATILDELRTPSFFSSARIVSISTADPFLAAHADGLIPHLETGFGDGYLLLDVEAKLDMRRKFSKQVLEHGWLVECLNPFDRPPPWESNTPVWDSDLSRWLSVRAREKGLKLSPQVAFTLHYRAGTDLAILDKELDKLKTYAESKQTDTLTEAAIEAVVGDTKENSIFQLVDTFLEGRSTEAVRGIRRLFERGYDSGRGSITLEPIPIALQFIGALLPRLRALRRAHAMAKAGTGRGGDAWVQAGLTLRPFLPRFERQVRAVSPRKLVRLFDRLYELDRAIKSGGDASRLVELLVIEFAR